MRKGTTKLGADETVFVGIDIHQRSWHVTMRTTEVELFSGSIAGTWEDLRKLLKRHQGNPVEAVYEAGYFGYRHHDRLTEYGAQCARHAAEFDSTRIRQSRQDRPS
jgi:hypothetical protein